MFAKLDAGDGRVDAVVIAPAFLAPDHPVAGIERIDLAMPPPNQMEITWFGLTGNERLLDSEAARSDGQARLGLAAANVTQAKHDSRRFITGREKEDAVIGLGGERGGFQQKAGTTVTPSVYTSKSAKQNGIRYDCADASCTLPRSGWVARPEVRGIFDTTTPIEDSGRATRAS